jgi:predicted RNase H-like nuclease (RuvC/YqgF family)
VIQDLTSEKQKMAEQIKEKSFDISREFRKSSHQSNHYSSANDFEFETRKELEKLLFQNSDLRREKLEIQAKADEYLEKIHKLNEQIEKIKQGNENELTQKQIQINELMTQLEEQQDN